MREIRQHVPVLLKEVIDGLHIEKGDIIVDATLGGAGHARALCEAAGGTATLIGFDADSEALERARKNLEGCGSEIHLVNANFRNIKPELDKLGIKQVNKALYDLGLGTHTYDSGRGFSFQKDEPLTMTLSDRPGQNAVRAYGVVNTWSEETLREILWGFGEEKHARSIVKSIMLERDKKLIETTAELVKVIERAVPSYYKHGRIHPATRTFQAIRIAVNDELNALSESLISIWEMLAPGGRLAVISFHSLEDRIVKRLFRVWSENKGKLINKRPVTPEEIESKENPRARSAKLRIIEKQ